jgi:hypothetical protein
MSDATSPLPTARLEYTTEPHPDPTIQAFIELVEQLRRENQELKDKLNGTHPR